MITAQELIEEGWSVEDAPKFAKWYNTVDAMVYGKIGMGIGCIGDYCYADNYEDGKSAVATAREVIYLFKRGEL